MNLKITFFIVRYFLSIGLKSLFILILFLFFLPKSFAQQNEEEFLAQKIPNLIPPSPNSASLGKFGDVPVGLYTGTPSISIPIFNVSVSGSSLPVSLDYHSSGIKVEELGSSVGLGWALNAGGVISRSIRGEDDFLPGGFLYNNGESGESVSDYINDLMTSSEEATFRQSVAKGLIDSQPDIYSFNFAGFSGKFIFNSSGEILTIPYQALKITRNSNGFTITDPSGIKYLFYEKETTFSNPVVERNGQVQPYLDPQQYTSSWYLSKVVLTNGKEIVLSYLSSIIEPEYLTSESRYFRELLLENCPEQIPFDMEYGIETLQDTEITQKKLYKIYFPKGEVEFVYDLNDRTDLAGDKALKSILIKDYSGTIKSFSLSHTYYSGRLFLTSVSEADRNSQPIGQPYQVQYTNPQNLPGRLSKAQDYWGYYNGKTSNSTLVPKENNSVYGQTNNFLYVNGADREPNSQLIGNGTIKKLTYPTGGYTEFEFEPHEFGNLGGSKNIIDTVRTSQTITTKLIAAPTGSETVLNFSITHQQIVNVETKVSGYNTYVRLINITNGNSIVFGDESNSDPALKVQNVSIPLNAGSYRLVAFNYEDEFTSEITVVHEENSPNYTLKKNRKGGGLRIKKITDFGNENEQIKERVFNYNLPGEQDRSSGVLVAQYNHDYFKQETACITCNEVPFIAVAKYLVRMSTSAIGMSYSQGNAVEYSDVVVFEDGHLGTLTGKTHSEFRTSKDRADFTFTTFPFLPPVSKSYLRGQLKEEEVFKYEGGEFVPIKKVINQYQSILNPEGAVYILNIGYETNKDCIYPTLTTFEENLGAYASEFYYNSQSTEIIFDESGNQSFQKVTNYEYDNLIHLQPTRISITNSDNSLESTKYFYPDDISGLGFLSGESLTSSEFDAIEELKSDFLHQINVPIQVEKWVGNSLVAKRRTLYKTWGNQLPFPHIIKSSIGNSGFDKRLEFLSYDNYSNPISISKNGELVGMLWFNNGEDPVAEVKNAEPNEISYTSFETSDKGGWTYTGTPVSNRKKTGKKGYELSSGAISKSGIAASSTTPYKVGFWAKRISGTGNVTVEGQTEALTTTWKWVEKVITSGTLTISGSNIVIDELRLHPADAMMTSYTYEPLIGMTSQTDPRGYTLIYLYDAAGRLQTIKDENGHILEHYKYNYSTGN